MALTIRVAIRDQVGKDFKVTEKVSIENLKENDLERVARECEKIIKNIIMTQTDKPTGHLASFFVAEPIMNGWGIGDIATLDHQAPYWNHIDKGSQGIGADWEHFLPKGYWLDGRWIEDENGESGIKPKTPIKAINYIDQTLAQMELTIPNILNRVI